MSFRHTNAFEDFWQTEEARADAQSQVETFLNRISSQKCEDGLLPDGPVCPGCGGRREPSGIGGGTWVHYDTRNAVSCSD